MKITPAGQLGGQNKILDVICTGFFYMSEGKFVSTLQAILDMLQRRTVIPAAVLQDVRSFSANLCQLLENYNWRFSNCPVATLDALRRELIPLVEREICACAPLGSPNLDQPPNRTVKACQPVSQKKLIANRQNSLRSTGPRTPQGKQAVRQNAVTHGLLSHPVVVLSQEELDQFENWRSKLRSWIGPKNEAEERLVSNAAVLIWKLGRCIRVQGSLLSTPGSADRWRTLHRYAGSLNRQLRELICDLHILRNEKGGAMSDKERKWDLRTDGELWKAAASAVDDPDFQKRCDSMVGGLQENLDRTDGLLFIVADSVAAAFIRKQQVLAYGSAHTRIATFNSRENVETADPSIRESARIAAAFPSDDVLDRSIKCESLCDRQIQKFMELVDRSWKSTGEQASDV